MKRKHLTVTLAAAIFAFAILPAYSTAAKPWYAPKLEKFGFFVFDPPFVYQDFKVTTLSGTTQSRTSTKGNIVLLNFWATWCPPCREEIPAIEALSKAMKDRKFEVFAVDVGEDLAAVKSFVSEQKITYPVYLDSRNILSRVYASQGIPTTYLLDKDGRFIAGMVGGYDYSNPDFIGFLAELAQK
jgi:thiol-disulfide isomerase/thioredoxin